MERGSFELRRSASRERNKFERFKHDVAVKMSGIARFATEKAQRKLGTRELDVAADAPHIVMVGSTGYMR
jgi:hypothetical protein